MHFAHSLPACPVDKWEPLELHLKRVAVGEAHLVGAAGFANAFNAEEWGNLAGLWHDVGKYSPEFQNMLYTANGVVAHLEDPDRLSNGKADHSTAGAQHALKHLSPVAGAILAYCIAGHHGGLPDGVNRDGLSDLSKRLKKVVHDYSAAPAELLEQAQPGNAQGAPDLVLAEDSAVRIFQLATFCRMLFSCLVDADYLATEFFVDQARHGKRTSATLPTVDELSQRLDAYLQTKFGAAAPDEPVNAGRARVLAECRAAAELPPGLFSLTVPTGGGKTFSSLDFALRHASRHGLRRVIYAIPFTSIIEQNAKRFHEALGDTSGDIVLEHHSNLDPPDDVFRRELATENWDAPVIVTTNVQLFESLFANRTSKCRKLHRIARSVIVLDECQTLPVQLLRPTLAMLEELARNYGCTIVFCTATMPALKERPDFPIGLKNVSEIVSDVPRLFAELKRVEIEQPGKLSDEDVVARMAGSPQVLAIVNTRKHAADLFYTLRESTRDTDGAFHLSAAMCPAHRSAVLKEMKQRLVADSPQPCRVVSTQLVEAGVDVDFPLVLRAMAGLDSIAQAAGRCNREGRLKIGKTVVFETDRQDFGEIRTATSVTREVIACGHQDLLSLEANEKFFELLYWSRKSEWDKKQIMSKFARGDAQLPLHFAFRDVAQEYKLIPDEQIAVIVPYDATAEKLIAEIRQMPEAPGRRIRRKLQRYAVNVYDRQFWLLYENAVIDRRHEGLNVLSNPGAYDVDLGLRFDVAGWDAETLIG